MNLKRSLLTLAVIAMFATLLALSTSARATPSAGGREAPAAHGAPDPMPLEPAGVPALRDHRRRICSERATLRLNPVAGSRELTTVYRGDSVYIRPGEFHTSGPWVKVRTEGFRGEFKVTGWILAHHFC